MVIYLQSWLFLVFLFSFCVIITTQSISIIVFIVTSYRFQVDIVPHSSLFRFFSYFYFPHWTTKRIKNKNTPANIASWQRCITCNPVLLVSEFIRPENEVVNQ